MSSCDIFNKTLLFDVDYESISINIDFLQEHVGFFDPLNSGLWQPCIINASSSDTKKVDFLSYPKLDIEHSTFDPTNCSIQSIRSYSDLEENNTFNCSYCNFTQPVNYTTSWQLKDAAGNLRTLIDPYGNAYQPTITADCSSGACDTRMNLDDYLPKIPYLNQSYLTKFYDWKYLNQFPAANNPGLGCDNFISFSKMKSFSEDCPSLVIDWKIRESISEIPYDKLKSQHDSEYLHHKSYAKSKKVSNTCGNFILTEINPEYASLANYTLFNNIDKITNLPTEKQFSIPYGFNKNTYNNIYIKQQKLASHWKWNYASGILCWYRHYDIDRKNDTRPIPGVDLYIPPGDVFFATNQGPEPPPVSYQEGMKIKPCPSGLKVIKDNEVVGVIPDQSKFIYISQNLYPLFLDLVDRIDTASTEDNNNLTDINKIELAALLCTAPQYDAITLDLLKRNNNTNNLEKNVYLQLAEFNKDMLEKTNLKSAGNLNYIQNKKDLVNTLADKYGCYLWCPPNSESTITLNKNIKSQCYIDLDFDMCTYSSDTHFEQPDCVATSDCFDNKLHKNFSYSQEFTLGNINLKTILDNSTVYKTECNNGTDSIVSSIKTSSLYINDTLLKEIPYNSGCFVLQDNYPRILTDDTTASCTVCDEYSTYKIPNVNAESICKNYQGDQSWCDAPSAFTANNSDGANVVGNRPARSILNNSLYFRRAYPASVFNPHIASIAFHHQGGVHYNSPEFSDISGTTVFSKSTSSLFDNDSDTNNLQLKFTTKNVGIKLYGIRLEKLRGSDSDTYNCRAFPVKNKCKCYGLSINNSYPYNCKDTSITYTNDPVLYTPNISTKYSPKIKSYGGYSSEKVSILMGGEHLIKEIKRLKQENKTIDNDLLDAECNIPPPDGSKDPALCESLNKSLNENQKKIEELELLLQTKYRIPNHPDVEQYHSYVSKYIDPIYPYGCEKSITISLNNYVHTNYNVLLPSYDTNHADVWAESIENVNLFRTNNFSTDPETGEFISSPNIGYQRYTTKVSLNGTDIYDQQRKVFAGKGSSLNTSVNIGLTNPFLEALLDEPLILYPPTGTLCNKNIFATRGDETSSVSIKFSRIPRKQLLNFYIQPQPMGFLKHGNFDPNKGLIDSIDKESYSPLRKNEIGNINLYYDKEAFDPDGDFSQEGLVLYGKTNSNLYTLLDQISSFDSHKKLKLYLQLGDRWYEYVVPDRYGFYNKESLNIGEPFIFEYLSKEENSRSNGPWLPSPPKKNIDFNFIYNYHSNNSDYIFTNYTTLPIIQKNKDNPKLMLFNGIRPYFYIAEKDDALVSEFDDLKILLSDNPNAINELKNVTIDRPEILLSNGERWRYTGGDKKNITSYVISNYNELYTNFSELHINYNKKNNNNYILNTKKVCNQKILIINKDNPKEFYYDNIVEKSIYYEYIDKYGNSPDGKSAKYVKIYTQFLLSKNLRYNNVYIDFNNIYKDLSNLEGMDSFVIFKDLKPMLGGLQKEYDILLSNNKIASKWADIIEYDDNLIAEITKYIYNTNYLMQFYPESYYDNTFYKTILNNCNYKDHKFLLKDSNNNKIFIATKDPVYYAIHQKYNTGYKFYSATTGLQDYQNYLPFMDINILPAPGTNTTNSRSNISNVLVKNLSNNSISIFSGLMNISGVHTNLPSSHKYEDGYFDPKNNDYFWIHLNKNNNLRSALSLVSDVKGFYSNTLRVDDPPYQLKSIKYQRNQASNNNCTNIFYPKELPTEDINFNNNTFNFDHFLTTTFDGGIFARYPIYCDIDKTDLCSNLYCNMNTIGWQSYIATYDIYQHKTKNIDSLIGLNNIPYILSYDAGFLNAMGSSGLPYIVRSEIGPNSPLYDNTGCYSDTNPRPLGTKTSIFNEEYQSIFKENIIDDHSFLVKNTDILANEMLFRLFYGENQKINLNRIDGSNDSVTLKDLIAYSDPKVEAKDIYRNIPYDLDIESDSNNRKIHGNINIKGVLKKDKEVTVSINNISMTFKIIEENGKIFIRFLCPEYREERAESILYYTSIESNNTVISTGPLSSTNTEKYLEISKCKQRRQIDINLSAKIIEASLPDAIDCEGNKFTAKFPYWNLDGHTGGFDCPINENNLFGICKTDQNPKHPSIYFVRYNGCANTNEVPRHECTNRDVGPVTISSDSSILYQTQHNIKVKDYARGVIYPGVCHFNGGETSPRSDVGFSNGGNIESMINTRIIDHPNGISLNPRYPDPECGTCYDLLKYKDWTGREIYNKFGRGFPPSPVSTSDACDCVPYEYGYCTNSRDAAGCVCPSLSYQYKDINYNFEYCRHSFNLKGFARKTLAQPAAPSLIIDPAPTPSCNASIATPSNGGLVELTEACTWTYRITSNPVTYYIYNRQTITQNAPYEPQCSSQLCNIIYDNNKITVQLGGSNNQPICFPINIRNDCPLLKVTVPDKSFAVTDSINSECGICDAEPNEAIINDSHPTWDIIEEDRTCVLGYFLEGNPNTNGPIALGGCQTVGCGGIGSCKECPSSSACNGFTTTACGVGLCGQSAPGSFPWSVCISKAGGGPLVGGNIGNKLAYLTPGACGEYPSVLGCDIPINFHIATSNEIAETVLADEWEENMKQIFMNIAACNNNINKYKAEDIVEGVVPGSCSEQVLYESLSYPAIMYRATLENPIFQSGAVSVRVAYYTYKYRRPKTIQDVLNKDNAKNCNILATHCDNPSLSLSSKYNTKSCDNTPSCYNTSSSRCDDNKPCCKNNLIDFPEGGSFNE